MSQAPTSSSGYVDVGGGLEMYYERRGEGMPLVLLHGAFGTIESCFSDLLPVLAQRFEVIAIELQGHGRTRDVDRPLSYPGMARDTAALVDALGVQQAHVVGYSMGGAVALQVALDRPELVERLVWAGGACFNASGVYPELAAGFESFDMHSLDGTPWHAAYCRVAPDPGAWMPLVAKVNELDRSGEPAWPRQRIAALQVPTLLIIGDADVVRPEHTVEMFRLLPAQLAILPGTSHEGMLERTGWLASMILSFLVREDIATGVG